MVTENVARNAYAEDVPEADALEQSAATQADDEIINALPEEPLGEPDAPVPPASEWDKIEQNVVVPADEDYS